LVVRYRGAGDALPIALVGKGITFDTGGISIKPGEGMWRMKYDMSGAARVVGATLATAMRRAPVNVTAVAALAENMPGDNATRPGDVVRTMNGQTMEIISTDAEGRVVLADANQYAARDKPAAIVNMATLTGSAAAALGDQYGALFARDEALARRIETAATASGDAVWRLPLHPAYAKLIKSDIADVKNSVEGRGPGASIGAHFIEHFTPKPIPWAHLDIAGVAWRLSATDGVDPQGASAYGVRLLHELVRSYEVK
jgi:leucyl aminopeptidase